MAAGCRIDPPPGFFADSTFGQDTLPEEDGEPFDGDGDGSPVDDDCDDANPAAYPGAIELCDGVDNDCDGTIDVAAADMTTWYTDADGDGYGDAGSATVACDAPAGTVADATDCDDAAATFHPGAAETDCADPADYNCDGTVGYADTDADGWAACEDCDDTDADVNDAGLELCDGIDNDCDGTVDIAAADVTPWYTDADGDGYGDAGSITVACDAPVGTVADATDCDDADATFHPGAAETDCADPADYNCDGTVGYADADADGWAACEDCDDTVADVNDAGLELCDGIDNDCDGTVDVAAADMTPWYTDADGDGYGNASSATIACDAPAGTVADATDCDDAHASIRPGVTEVCNGMDDDCDAAVDDADAGLDLASAETWYTDADGDGYGDPADSSTACVVPSGDVGNDLDCDDTSAGVRPGATEVCNGVDDDCDSDIDDADPSRDAATADSWYADLDGDGYGDVVTVVVACAAPSGAVADATDCDDTDALFHPTAVEDDCTDPADYNCDGTVGYADADADGWAACEDCDDTRAGVNPDAIETCDGLDNDCDGDTYDADASRDSGTAEAWFTDADGDGYGDATELVVACDAPSGAVADATDCDDADDAVHPSASEVCNGFDDDCDGLVDDADSGRDAASATTWYADFDGDGFGDPAEATIACTVPSDHVAGSTDCDDTDADVRPSATEICNTRDDDCDGSVDDADGSLDSGSTTAWYVDTDADGYGSGTAMLRCAAPSGRVAPNGDCDDTDTDFHPGAYEGNCADPSDYNCDGSTGFVDADDDGWAACEECDDASDDVNPDATEVCDGVDNNCDAAIDDADATLDLGTATLWYSDADSDGAGDATTAVYACAASTGTLADDTDCDDDDAAVNPHATEVCNGIDDDCDAAVDDADPSRSSASAGSWFTDADADGYGDATDVDIACVAPTGTVGDDTDCDDTDPAVRPGATEVCNGVDDDCDSAVDDADPSLNTATAGSWYADSDGDGYGSGTATLACTAPSARVTNHTDCNDGNAAVNPAATEVCDAGNTDENCNGLADDADGTVNPATKVVRYEDDDGDGYGSLSSAAAWCDPPSGVITDHSDCDDTDADRSPAETETCDDVDNDCDGVIDWGNRVPYDYATIQAAINASTTGDVVCVGSGSYAENIDLDGRAVTVEGTDGSDWTTIEGDGTGPVVTINSGEGLDTVLSGFTITGGAAAAGAGVYVVSASPTLSNLYITGNTCSASTCRGTGLYLSVSNAVVDEVSASGNTATVTSLASGIGAYFGNTNATVTDSQFDGNMVTCAANVYGTGLTVYDDNGGTPTFSNVTVDENITTLTSSSAGNQYGSMYVYNTGASFDEISVSANEGYDGYNVWSSGVTEYYSTANWTHARVDGNIADTYYVDAVGLRLMYSASDWTNATIAGNRAIATYTALASGVFVDRGSAAVFTNVDVVKNEVDGSGTASVWTSGFGEYRNGSTITLRNVNVSGNSVGSGTTIYSGGVYSTGYVSITYSNVYGNSVADYYGMSNPTGTNGNLSAEPDHAYTSGADPAVWDFTLGWTSVLIDAGSTTILDGDGSPSDIGSMGGPGGAWTH